ncbi:flavodoxin domain-containing protein [Svornostia abyssi]|uniref:Flavodoxin domain-containing protein n=1 Tax=Svornostia abyssi TaxID=2898438 RepID=A0ABY5PCT6_9ACTN|nr:flavodoxin domain-containing protein [Parviterribacteraceae bacterium J379]
MRVLVTAASKHGSTEEIGQAIVEELDRRGIVADFLVPEAVRSVDGFDAVVVGSAVYAGHWLKPARDLIDRIGPDLRDRAVWLFSSGPVGEPEPKPDGDPADVDDLIETVGAREHVVFPGRIKREELGFAERAIVRALRVPDGDFRDWVAIDAWAGSIAAVLTGAVVQ